MARFGAQFSGRRRSWARRAGLSPFNVVWLLIFVAAWALFMATSDRPLLSLPKIGERPTTLANTISASFAMCSAIRRNDCVIDGDTFILEGDRIRIADIDAPETHPARCAQEERLGTAATRRLRELLNKGPFSLLRDGRDEDRYGRKLRTVVRDGGSLGGVLVAEGLARRWTGHRRPWCS